MSGKKDLDNLLRTFIDRGLPGAALSVCKDGEIIYESFCGYRDTDKTKPLTEDTLFRIHSITKVYSALCGMMEYERGAFLMDDPVSEYLPEYKNLLVSIPQEDGTFRVEEAKEPMLIRHLFNMRVGHYSFGDNPTANAMKEIHEKLGGSKFLSKYSLREEIRALAEVPMLFEPGSHFQYGYGIDIMAVIVEITSGMSLGEYMSKKIFEPLGMENTGFRFRPGWEERLAGCVRHNPDGSVSSCNDLLGDPLDTMYAPDGKYEAADAGLLSTLGDLQTFSAMLAGGGAYRGERIIGRKTLDMMRSNLLDEALLKEFTTAMPDMEGYGYGYGVRTMLPKGTALIGGSVGEFGWLGAAGAWMMADPSENLSAAFMIQDMLPNSKYYNNRLKAAIYGLF